MGSKLKLEKRLRNAEYAKRFKKKKKRAARPAPASTMPIGGAEVVCAACGILTHVPFQPTTGKPVYCRSCFSKPQPAIKSVTMASPAPAREAPAPEAPARPPATL